MVGFLMPLGFKLIFLPFSENLQVSAGRFWGLHCVGTFSFVPLHRNLFCVLSVF